ncbi:MAG: CarD family transcriptional regulator, partial [Acutalibacteraceae bacterium]|nr:CarD family transcriptional regulator [Acutalibacteraceae bacterium]
MQFLNSVIARTKGYKALINAVMAKELPIEANGLSDIHKALILSALISDTGQKAVLITPDEADAVRLADDLSVLGIKAIVMPSRDLFVGNVTAVSKEYEHKRIDTLSSLLDGAFDLLCISAEAATQYTPSVEFMKKSIFTLSVGDTAEISELAATLISAGYTRCELVEGTGQFALRGGILDIFSPGSDNPCRIEFWGDEIDSISSFDTVTQRRQDNLESIKLVPAGESVCPPDLLLKKLEDYLASGKRLTDKQRAVIRADIDALRAGVSFSLDRYIPLFCEGTTVFDYLDDPLVVTSETVAVRERIKNLAFRREEDIKTYLEEGFLSAATAALYIDEADLMSVISQGVLLDNFMPSSIPFGLKSLIPFDFKRNSPWSGDITVLKEDVHYTLSVGGTVVVAAGSEKAAQILDSDLNAAGYNTMFLKDIKGLPSRGAVVTVGGLSSGFEIPELKFVFVTHRHISGDVKPSKIRRKNKNGYNSIEELKYGDYVVHASHGIGIFDGINRITAGGVTKDYIKIKYAKGDLLYVPVTQLDLVSKYIGGAEEGTLRL